MDHGDAISSRASLDGEPPPKRTRTSNVAQTPREVGLMRSLPGDKFSSFIGSSSGIWFIRAVYGAISSSNRSPGSHIQTPEADIVPGEDDHLPQASPNSSKRLWREVEVTANSNAHPSFEDLVEWSGSYFANWHPAYPFLHAPAILKLFENIARDGVSPDLSSQSLDIIIIQSIMSISLADNRQDPSPSTSTVPTILVFSSYDAAITSLHVALSQATSIQSLQAAICVQLFLVSMLRLNAASRLGGLIIRMALQLGLHRCPNRFPSFSPTDRELRQRIFWSLYCIDRFVCQSMGLPLSLRDDDIDVCYPSNEQHLAGQIPSDTRLALLEFLARHSQIRGQIMELRNKSILHSQKETNQADIIIGKLGRWWNDVEDFIDSDAEDSSSMGIYHRAVLTVLYHETVMSLNRPTLATSTKGPAFNVALQLCIGSSRSIITTLYRAIKPLRGSNHHERALSLLWPSFTWAVWMSTFVLFHAAHSKHLSQATASRLSDRSLEILKHLSDRGSVWPEACAAAIRDLKIHLLPKPTSPSTDIAAHLTTPGSQHSHRPSMSRQQPTQLPSIPFESSSSHIPDGLANGTIAPESSSATQYAGQTYGPHTSALTLNRTMGSRNTGLTGHSQPDRAPVSQSDNQSGYAGHNTTNEHPDQSFENFDWNLHLPAPAGLSEDLPLPGDGADLFSGFDIPFWIGQDQYSDMVNDWS
ncbi:hypothetical protein P154DRAFT_459757 [Amniculicola lignicola CBS 123094]|uniref:Xylanolytic transcriptional activator regulatory domain-containing protein n=1 Tax=Amniculicola lignicola CBS 123094 TaxID=1392246 RepID=A0A6A5WTG0_9PLEO|nr:hypothetical protein P154DRAFT_459757 [Amniculicola lignicola CBS 123094]